jgi:ATP-dependent HslUV protease, peptidase subunit HslV
MTTITVVRKDGAAAIAADSMTTYGSRKESAELVVNHHKIFRVRDSWLAVAGPAGAQQILEHYFAKQGKNARLDDVPSIFSAWLSLHGALKEAYYVREEEEDDDSYESSRMDVLIANPRGIFAVDAFRYVQELTRFYAFGYGQEYALGAMHAVHTDPSLSAEQIARIGVEAGIAFDNSSGMPVLSYTVALEAPGAGSAGR